MEEVGAYERLKRGKFEDLDNLRGLGHLLITSRLRKASPSARSRDGWVCKRRRLLAMSETNISASRSSVPPKILDALNVRLRTQVAIQPLPPFPVAQAS
jgi:hypothetical protein